MHTEYLCKLPDEHGRVRFVLALQSKWPSTTSTVRERNRALATTRRMWFRLGLDTGDVIVAEDGRHFGEPLNIAARIQAIAEVGGINVTEAGRCAAGCLAAEAGAAYCLATGLARSGERLRAYAEVVDVTTFNRIWGQRWEAPRRRVRAAGWFTTGTVRALEVELVVGSRRGSIARPSTTRPASRCTGGGTTCSTTHGRTGAGPRSCSTPSRIRLR